MLNSPHPSYLEKSIVVGIPPVMERYAKTQEKFACAVKYAGTNARVNACATPSVQTGHSV